MAELVACGDHHIYSAAHFKEIMEKIDASLMDNRNKAPSMDEVVGGISREINRIAADRNNTVFIAEQIEQTIIEAAVTGTSSMSISYTAMRCGQEKNITTTYTITKEPVYSFDLSNKKDIDTGLCGLRVRQIIANSSDTKYTCVSPIQ